MSKGYPGYLKAEEAAADYWEPAVGIIAKGETDTGKLGGTLETLIKQNNFIIELLVSANRKLDTLSKDKITVQDTDYLALIGDINRKISDLSVNPDVKGKSVQIGTRVLAVKEDPRKQLEIYLKKTQK